MKNNDIYGLQKILEINVKNPNSKRHENSCKCQCIKCGKISYRPMYTILNGSRISCVCQKSNNTTILNKKRSSIKIGNLYGFLKVKEDLGFREQKRGRRESWYKCECLNCGNNNYEVSGSNLTSGGCTSCGCVSSKGEQKIKEIFIQNDIIFKTQYTFEDLKDKDKLRFDFAIFDENNNLKFLLEFDGRQHYYGPDAKWQKSNTFDEIKRKDNMKDDYCKSHNLILKRIPFYDISKINLSNLLDETYII